MIPESTLKRIADRDPDGHGTRPTDEQYVAFRRWVINTLGVTAWRAYHMDR